MNSWERWGAQDERGAANLIDAAAVQRGLAAARRGEVLSLALPLRPGAGSTLAGRQPLQHFMTRTGADYAAGRPERPGFGFADDYVLMATHGGTHMDALSHVWQDGLMYNGIPASEVTSEGARRLGIEHVGALVTRGLCVDLVPPGDARLPDGHRVSGAVLAAAVAATGVEPQSGDALLVRTGWTEAWIAGEATSAAWPGLDADCADWLIERGLAIVGADNPAIDPFPPSAPDCQVPLHVALLRNHGVYLCELLDLAALVASGRPDFLLVLAPLPVVGAVGSPLAPVAVL